MQSAERRTVVATPPPTNLKFLPAEQKLGDGKSHQS